jgi:anti-anti-sigma factor
MSFVEERFNDIVVEIVDVERATLQYADEFKQTIMERLAEGDRKFIVDLSACEFIDSTFLGALVNALKKVAKAKGDMRLVGFRKNVKSMFELTRLFRVFETYPDLQSAIKSYQS